MKATLMGMPCMGPTGWLDHLLRTARWIRKGLPEGRLIDRTRKFTLLDDAVRGFGGAAAKGWTGETVRQRQLSGMHHLGGERRPLFGVGEGPAEAVAGAKQDQAISASYGWVGKAERPWRAGGSGAGDVVPMSLESASFLRHSPVVNHLSVTCSATCQPLVTLISA